MKIYHGDVLTFNMEKCVPGSYRKNWDDLDEPNIHIIGNLPFNISLPLLFKLMRQISFKSDIFTFGRVPLTLTFQKEVGERIICPVSLEQRSRISIMCQYLCQVQYKFTIPGFYYYYPPPSSSSLKYPYQKATKKLFGFSRLCICTGAKS